MVKSVIWFMYKPLRWNDWRRHHLAQLSSTGQFFPYLLVDIRYRVRYSVLTTGSTT